MLFLKFMCAMVAVVVAYLLTIFFLRSRAFFRFQMQQAHFKVFMDVVRNEFGL